MSERISNYYSTVPKNWKLKSINDIAIRVGSGITPTGGSKVYSNSGIIFVRSQNVTNSGLVLDDVAFIDNVTHERMISSELFPFDVLLNITGASIGRCCVFPSEIGRANVNQHVCAIRLQSPNYFDAKFLSLLFASPIGQNQILRLNAGGNREGLNYQQIRSMCFLFPPPERRAKIARILTTIDNLIEKTEALIAKYQSIKQGLMHDLFTRGVDANGKLRPPQAEAPELYKQSELGWIPKEWDKFQLLNVIPKAEYGISVPLDDSEGIPVMRMNNLAQGKINTEDIKFSKSLEANKTTLKKEDILFNRTNSIEHVGRTSIWNNELPIASFASYLVRLVPDRNFLNPRYLVFWMNLPQTQMAIRKFATIAVHQVNINPTNLRKVSICLPRDLKFQSEVEELVQKNETLLSKEYSYLDKLKLKKTALMQDLLTGKVQVTPDAVDMEPAHE